METIAVLLLATITQLGSDVSNKDSFGDLEAKATPIKEIGAFLQKILGDCDQGRHQRFEKQKCLEEAERNRKGYKGRLLVLNVKKLSGYFSKPRWNARRRAYKVMFTPVFGSRGLGLSVGRPKRLDRQGRPVMRRIALWLTRPSSMPEFVFFRNIERGMVSMKLFIKLVRPWTLKKRDLGEVRGISVELKALQLRSRQTVLAERRF